MESSISYYHPTTINTSYPTIYYSPQSIIDSFILLILTRYSDCPLIFFETLIGAIVSAPMNPLVASSMFFLSYARPIKFWEKNYK